MANGKLDSIELTVEQANDLLISKVKQIFSLPAVIEQVKTAIRDPQNPLGLSSAEQALFKGMEGGMHAIGKVPLFGRAAAKRVTGEVDDRIRDEAVNSERASAMREALIAGLSEPITVGALQEAMRNIGEHLPEFKVLGFDNEDRLKEYVPEGEDTAAFVEKLETFSEAELLAVGAISNKWKDHATNRVASRER